MCLTQCAQLAVEKRELAQGVFQCEVTEILLENLFHGPYLSADKVRTLAEYIDLTFSE